METPLGGGGQPVPPMILSATDGGNGAAELRGDPTPALLPPLNFLNAEQGCWPRGHGYLEFEAGGEGDITTLAGAGWEPQFQAEFTRTNWQTLSHQSTPKEAMPSPRS